MERKFNEEQRKAVKWLAGPCLVLSGPGSGKTFVITNRIINLIKNENVDPNNILVITFTRAAANEMKARFLKLLNEERINSKEIPTFGTFHSVFFEILKDNFGYNNDSLIDIDNEKILLCKTLEKEEDLKIDNDLLNNIISDIKNYKLSIERQDKFIPRSLSEDLFKKVYEKYQEKLFNAKKLDFFDMIDKTKNLLLRFDDIRKIYSNRYKYILIDEFQDINKSQYDLIKLICENNNLFVVGDDDQSIYRFRGSHPKVMKDFLNDYKGAEIINLNTNYRCARVIVKFSKLIIDNNNERFKKDLKPARNDIGKLEIKAFVDANEENEYLINKIIEYRKKGIAFSDMAILYRTNLLSSAIRIVLNKHNIDYRVKGDYISIFDNFACKDIMSYLKYAKFGNDTESLMSIMNKPVRYISRDAVNYKDATIDSLLKYYKNKDYILKYITKFKHDLRVINNNITPVSIRYIRSEVGYDEYLKSYCKKKNIDYEEATGILDEFEEASIGHNSIKEFIDFVDKQKDIDKKNLNEMNNEKDAISLMTFHLSKGLEFKVVFIIDANDGLIPHKKSIRDNDIETERRLFYVGMTRAKDYLHIFFTTRRFGKNFKASRFILEAVGGQSG